MSCPRSIILSVLAAWFFLAGARGAEPVKDQVSAGEIAKLVGQLGAPGKATAERAGNRLVKIGPVALAALRKAIAQDPKKPLAKSARAVVARIARASQKTLENYLAKLKARPAVVRQVTNDSLARVFPAVLVFSVRFPLYPRAVRPPPGLKANNLFIVDDRDSEPEQVINFKELEAYFRAHLAPVKGKRQAGDVARAWLWMSQELSQDGFLRFSMPADAVKVGLEITTLKAIGRATVKPEKGNKGHIQVTITFDVGGLLEDVKETKDITPGTRPK
jgi:hypothetical protein